MWKTIKKTEYQRIDVSNYCAGEHSRGPWTPRRSNQSILKEINPEYYLERLMLMLQYFGHLMWTANSLEKTLLLGKIEGRRRGQQRVVAQHHRFNGHELGQILGDDEEQGGLAWSPMGHKESDTTWRLNNNINKTDNQQEPTYSTGNYTQHFIIIYKGKDPDKPYVYVYINYMYNLFYVVDFIYMYLCVYI